MGDSQDTCAQKKRALKRKKLFIDEKLTKKLHALFSSAAILIKKNMYIFV